MPKGRSVTFVAPFALPLLRTDVAGSSGGAERQFLLFGLGLRQRGWDVKFITAPAAGFDEGDLRLPVCFARFSYLGGSKVRLPLDWASLVVAMRSADTHFYVLKTPKHLLGPMSVFCRCGKARRRVVYWAQAVHDADPAKLVRGGRALRWLDDWGRKRADCVIAQTQGQQRAFRENLGIESHVVPSICALLPGSRLPSRECGSVDVLWAGNSRALKRPELALEVARRLPHRRFAMAMNPAEPDRFVATARAAGTIPNMQFLGTVPPSEAESLFDSCRVLLNTSTYEGFPNTFLQAWMRGVPVVSACVDPDGVILGQGLGAVACLPGNGQWDDSPGLSDALAQRIESLLRDGAAWDAASRASIQYVQTNHSEDVVVPRLIQVLEGIGVE